jgi:hypothetical protein
MTAPSQPPSGLPASVAPTVNKTSLIIGGLGLVAIGALAAVLLTGSRTPVADPAAVQASASALVAAAPSAPALPAPPAEPALGVIAAPPRPAHRNRRAGARAGAGTQGGGRIQSGVQQLRRGQRSDTGAEEG